MLSHQAHKVLWNKDSISVENLDIKIGSTHIVTNANFTISRGDRIVLLGRNGCGKSTLFHWITETKEPSWSVYEVVQELPSSDQSILNIVLSAHLERGALYARMGELEAKEEMTDEEYKEYTGLQQQLISMKAEADPPRAKKILAGLGFQTFDIPLNTLSGGWRARVALAQGLFMEPDLLMLDEPTNHLDLEAVLWLSNFCKRWKKTLLVISHNQGFVRDIANSVWHLQTGKLTSYKCSYNRFLKQREQDLKKQERDYEQLEKELLAIKKKGTPQSKKQHDELLAKRTKEGVCRPEKPYKPKFFIRESQSSLGDAALLKTETTTLGYSQGTPILTDVTFSLYAGTRVALVGANGSGKSTLVKFLEGTLEPLEGMADRRRGLRVCKFDQHFYSSLPEDKTPLEYLTQFAPNDFVRKVLGASGLAGEAQTRTIGTLSGGQKARVYFASISVQSPDILLLDEPTNHLDMETIEGLQFALQDYPGAVLMISHDLDFLEELATEVWMTKNKTLTKLSEGPDGLTEYVNSVTSTLDDE